MNDPTVKICIWQVTPQRVLFFLGYVLLWDVTKDAVTSFGLNFAPVQVLLPCWLFMWSGQRPWVSLGGIAST